MPKFPVDAPKTKVIRALFRSSCTQAGISRNDFLDAYNRS